MILFFGPPGSGKSIQGQLLVDRYNWHWLSTGHMFRASTDPKILARLARGELIDDDKTNQMVSGELKKHQSSANKTRIIIDGYPRNMAQAEWLEEHLPKHGREIRCVIVLELPKAELIKRLSRRGRDDDDAAVIEKRLAIYKERTKPLLDFYKGRKVPFCQVDGQGSVEEVHERIHEALRSCKLV